MTSKYFDSVSGYKIKQSQGTGKTPMHERMKRHLKYINARLITLILTKLCYPWFKISTLKSQVVIQIQLLCHKEDNRLESYPEVIINKV